MRDNDGLIRQSQTGVKSRDCGVVPLRDIYLEYLSSDSCGEVQRDRSGYSGQIIGDCNRAYAFRDGEGGPDYICDIGSLRR